MVQHTDKRLSRVYNHLSNNHFKTNICHSLYGSLTWSLEKNTAGTDNCSNFEKQINFLQFIGNECNDSYVMNSVQYRERLKMY
jgi:hypothetical protein